jgi:hypothetical protein
MVNNCNILSNVLGEVICGEYDKTSFLDANNIVWKSIDGKWIGKRSVWTLDFRGCWLEDTTIDNVKSWWCGKGANYTEVFKRSNPNNI